MPKKIKLLSIEEDKVSVVDENGAEVPDEPEPTAVAVEKPITDIEEVPQEQPKPKPKRQPRAKPKKEIEEELNIVIPVEPADLPAPAVPAPKPVAEAEKPKENTKTIELVTCPKCNKKVTAKTLKYSHERVCPATKPTEQVEEVAKPVPRAKPVEVAAQPEPPVHERIRRMNNRKENYKNLVIHAF
jgi:hypothetical protein